MKSLGLKHQLTLAALLFFTGAVAVLLWPLSPPEKHASLLDHLPASTFPIGLEFRHLHRELDDLATGSLAAQFSSAESPYLKTFSHWLGRVRSEPLLRLGLKAAGVQAALGLHFTPRQAEAVLVLRLDNLSWLALRLAEWWQGEAFWSTLGHGVSFQSRWRGRYLFLATLPALRDAITVGALDERGSRSTQADQASSSIRPYPEQGMILRCHLNDSLRRLIKYRLGSDLVSLKDGEVVFTRQGDRFSVASRFTLFPEFFNEAERGLQATTGRVKRSRAPAYHPPQSLSLTSDDIIALAGWADLKLCWTGLSQRLWPQHGRPVASQDDPLLVLFWQGIDQSLMAYGDGRFSLSLARGKRYEDTLPVPSLKGALGTTEAEQAHQAVDREAGRMVTLFRAPGGPVLWESVRRETRLTPAVFGITPTRISRLALHPLFFHHMTPQWRSCEGLPGFYFGSQMDDGENEVWSQWSLDQEAGGTCAFVFAWQFSPDQLGHWQTLIHDKVANHGWLDPSLQVPFLKGVDRVRRLSASMAEGQGRVSLRRRPLSAGNGGEESNAHSIFYLDSRVGFRLQVASQK